VTALGRKDAGRRHGGRYLASSARKRNVSIDNTARIAKGLRIEAWKLLRDD
jgi:hypothetical protein